MQKSPRYCLTCKSLQGTVWGCRWPPDSSTRVGTAPARGSLCPRSHRSNQPGTGSSLSSFYRCQCYGRCVSGTDTGCHCTGSRNLGGRAAMLNTYVIDKRHRWFICYTIVWSCQWVATSPAYMPTCFNHSMMKFKNSSLMFIGANFLYLSIGEDYYQLSLTLVG